MISARQAARLFVKRGRAGVTLLETVMAIMILGVGFAGACALIVQTGNLSDMARDHYVAINLCKNRIEKARAMPFAAVTSLCETNVVVDEGGNVISSARFMRTTDMVYVQTNLIQMTVRAEVKNRFTLDFSSNDCETIATYVVEY